MSSHRKVRHTLRNLAQTQPSLAAITATVLFKPSGRITSLRDLKARIAEIGNTGHPIASEIATVFEACDVRIAPIVHTHISTELIPVKDENGKVDMPTYVFLSSLV